MSKKWEYKVEFSHLEHSGINIYEGEWKAVSKNLNEIGQHGWELVAFNESNTGYIWIFKRELSKGTAIG